MNLKTRLQDELNRAAMSAGQSGAFPPVALDLPQGQLICVLTSVDQLACAFERMTFRTPALADASLDQLTAVATALSRRLSYLLEAISPVEIDAESCVVQLRSNPPLKDDEGTSYYELVVRRGELELCRYTKESGAARHLVPATVTREVLYRLAQDLATAT